MITIKYTPEKAKGRHTQYSGVGDTFMGKIGDIEGLFLKTYVGIVCLNNPMKTWGQTTVEDFQEVDLEINVVTKCKT